MNKKWFCNMIALAIAISLGACYVDANASVTDISYVQETDDEDLEISDKDILTYYSGFDYAYFRLSLARGLYSTMIQQSALVSLSDLEAKSIDEVLSRTFNLLEKYEKALGDRNFEECKQIINDLSLLVPEIKRSLAPVLIPDSLTGSLLVFDDEGLVSDDEGFLTEKGEHVSIIDDGFFTFKPSSIQGLNKWFGLLGEDFIVPYYSLVTDSIAIWQLPIIYPEAFGLYINMIEDVSEEFSVDSFTISVVDGQYKVAEKVLRGMTDEEKQIYDSVSLIIAAERENKVDLEEFSEAVKDINTESFERQIKESSDYLDDMPFGEEFIFPDEDFSYKKTI